MSKNFALSRRPWQYRCCKLGSLSSPPRVLKLPRSLPRRPAMPMGVFCPPASSLNILAVSVTLRPCILLTFPGRLSSGYSLSPLGQRPCYIIRWRSGDPGSLSDMSSRGHLSSHVVMIGDVSAPPRHRSCPSSCNITAQRATTNNARSKVVFFLPTNNATNTVKHARCEKVPPRQ